MTLSPKHFGKFLLTIQWFEFIEKPTAQCTDLKHTDNLEKKSPLEGEVHLFAGC